MPSPLDPSPQGVLQAFGDKMQLAGNAEIIMSAAMQNDDFKKVYAVQSPCKSDNSDARGIQRIIKNLQNDIQKIKRFSNINSAIDALINEDVEPGKTIKKIVSIATGDIAGYVKNILGRVRGWVLNSIQNNVKKVLPFLFPSEMPSFIDKLDKGVNGLSCAFAKIVRGLAKTVGNLLLELIDKFINGPLCLIEDFIADLLRSITDPISQAISAINAILGNVVGAVLNLAESLFNAIDFITGIVNFFKCDDDKACPTQHEISRSGDSSNTTGNTGDPVTPSIAESYGSGKGVGTSATQATLDQGINQGGGVDWYGDITPEQRQEAVDSLELF